jgi:dethiobiotin synthetase
MGQLMSTPSRLRGVARGFFVTGTDTGVGKTVAACSLVRALRRAGVDTGGFKPVETGVGEAGPLDAEALREAAGSSDSLALVCPARFALPAAPYVAARVQGHEIDVAGLLAAFEEQAARHRAVVVEGAGGLLVPISREHDMASLAGLLHLPVIVVARAALGTINHTLLTLQVARQRGLTVAGVVISHGSMVSPADEENLAFLREDLGELLLAELPFDPEVAGSTAGESVWVENTTLELLEPMRQQRGVDHEVTDEMMGKALVCLIEWLRT